MSDAPRPDPRFRPYRAASWGLYLVVTSFVGLSVTISVIRSVNKMTPARPELHGSPLDPAQCRTLAGSLFKELDDQRQQLAHAPVVKRVDADWTRFRVLWMNELKDAEARCDVDAADRVQVKATFNALARVADLYTTHAVQFAGEVGPALDTLHAALAEGTPPAAQGLGVPGSTTP